MNRYFTIIAFCLSFSAINAQSLISGVVTDQKGGAIIGANVFIAETYDGASTDTNGRFRFTTTETGSHQLKVTVIGYANYEEKLVLPIEKLEVSIKMVESINQLEAVVITAGSFTAGEEKSREVLKPLDIVTTAGATADIPGALNTLPGTQKVGETGRLFVRGGEGYETKTFIDGLEVMGAYSPSAPNTPSRSRFSPFMFSGTSFSTGGYSAEYGQALSSALILKSKDVPEETRTDISLMSVGADVSHSHALSKGAVAGKLQYTNLTPYFEAVSQKMKWDEAPRSADGNVMFRKELKKGDMLKLYTNFSWSDFTVYQSGILPQDIDDRVALTNFYNYFNTSYRSILNDRWTMQSGVSYTRSEEQTKVNQDNYKEAVQGLHFKSVFTHDASEKVALTFGAEHFTEDYNFGYPGEAGLEQDLSFDKNTTAAFGEAEVYTSNRFVARVGIRGEYNSLQEAGYFAPRTSMAFKTGEHSQLSVAYGVFNQTGTNELIRIRSDLEDERAQHYIINYQHEIKGRTFRVEGYYKDYDNLIKFGDNNFDPSGYTNDGSGYARGLDVFWRDNITFKGVDYWLSYSFLDTERDYRNFPYRVRPRFASKHNFSAVFKYFIRSLKTQVGGTYSYTSGRPYHNPNLAGFNTEETPAYHDLSMNFSYLMKTNVIIHASVTNVLGIDNVFGYESSAQRDENGQYVLRAIKQPAPRFIFLGIFITLSKNKSVNQLPVL
ncbi:TonB-dependent receptor [Fulvivirga imtechensis AK7]|uniref:TonB-dependent receptor n=1 Tax=Fulvivirga imtechensis AK7 TaxID=1237149 RepID=L8JM11_9BACT|nr:TonB-dependent receptor [Fulvivirga imtechensis]ELR69243.1 TonB-dependent receptor [Fulvivirga imtechensis AK7]